jgi:acyl-CoA hydrolase/GNAT superfamily N-acetyltransferase
MADPIAEWRGCYPDKFVAEEEVFSRIHRGNVIFVGTACGEPQYLVGGLTDYVGTNPKAFFDAEILHVMTLGVAPYADEKYKQNFRHNSFFVGDSTRSAINRGAADYTPVFLSRLPRLFYRKLLHLDVALIQVSLPDKHGYVSLGVSVDIVKAAVENAALVIAQANRFMPRTHGDSLLHLEHIDFIVHHDEPLLEYSPKEDTRISQRIGQYVARLVEDGDTIQVGYGNITNSILANLTDKRHLGVHSELLNDGIVRLMKAGVIDNTRKKIDRGKTVATFCMGNRETYDFIDDNPAIEFRTIDYTNNPLIIVQQEDMVAINSALEIDLTGQATAESIGKTFYSGVGGQADFMRGTALSPRGKSILTIPSTADGETRSRIVPYLTEGAGTTLIRADMEYVVTEYGIAYLQGKNVRERAMALISIAHPKFQAGLIEEGRKAGLLYHDQAFIPGLQGTYPEEWETYRTTRTGLRIFFRPIKISDESLLKDFIYSLSDKSMYRRFISVRKDMPHERLQELVVIDYTQETAIAAVIGSEENEEIVGVGRYFIDSSSHTAEAAFAIRDDYQNRGIGSELLSYLTYLAKRQGLLGFTAEVLAENEPMLHVFEKGGFAMEKRNLAGVLELKMSFRD